MKRLLSYAIVGWSVFSLPLIASTIVSPFTSLTAAEPNGLQSVLAQEAAGEAVDRRLTSGSQPNDNATAWHSGLVKLGAQWQKIEELSSTAALEEYISKRDELMSRPQAHLILARWCANHQLTDRARAHYFGVLTNDPHNAEARKYLGHVLVGETWVSQVELESSRQNLRNNLTKLEQWVPPLQEIVKQLSSNDAATTRRALAELEAVDTVAALPALELFASNVDDDLSQPLIRKIAGLKSREACEALVRIALAHTSNEVRQRTATAIAQYPKEFFVPQLLDMLSGEIEVVNLLVMRPNGSIGLETLMSQELRNRKQVQRLQKLVNVISVFSAQHSMTLNNSQLGDSSYWSEYWNVPKSDPIHWGKQERKSTGSVGSASVSSAYVPGEVAVSAAANLAEQGKQAQRSAAQQNRARQERVNQICTLLRATTHADVGDKPELWWDWWNETNERYEGIKPTAYTYSVQREQIAITSRAYSSQQGETSRDFGKMLMQYSCLAAGTLVQTESGLIPIEQIQIGDRVLSQNVETAELTLKPVILTTVRPPKSTIQIVSGSNMIDATGGHLWWVSGKGWLRTRELEPGMQLHTATSTMTVDQLIPNPTEQPTFNLVVDSFHTYFVGPERVLSYDNTLVKPTLRQLPGYGQLP